MELPPLQPLRLPAGWIVEYNDFREVDPPGGSVGSDWLREDLLQLKHAATGILIDVGWYGEGDSGEFAVYIKEGDFHGKCLGELRSRDRQHVVAEVERLLLAHSGDRPSG
jgi:hypothetical protein